MKQLLRFTIPRILFLVIINQWIWQQDFYNYKITSYSVWSWQALYFLSLFMTFAYIFPITFRHKPTKKYNFLKGGILLYCCNLLWLMVLQLSYASSFGRADDWLFQWCNTGWSFACIVLVYYHLTRIFFYQTIEEYKRTFGLGFLVTTLIVVLVTSKFQINIWSPHEYLELLPTAYIKGYFGIGCILFWGIFSVVAVEKFDAQSTFKHQLKQKKQS